MQAVIIIVGGVLLLLAKDTYSLKCFTCAYTQESPGDKACVTNPEEVMGAHRVTRCAKKYCTIIRQEKSGSSRKDDDNVISFSRNCMDKPPKTGKFDDGTSIFYQYSCTKDLCNIGDGRTRPSAVDYDSGAGDNMIVKPKNNAVAVALSLGALILSLLSSI